MILFPRDNLENARHGVGEQLPAISQRAIVNIAHFVDLGVNAVGSLSYDGSVVNTRADLVYRYAVGVLAVL